jgi:RND family efflux transporter MFP subunit
MKYKKTIRFGVVISILVIGFVGMGLLSSADKKSNKREIKPDIRTVSVSNLETKDITLHISGNGVIESKRSLNIVSEVSGKVVYAKNNLKSGTFVKKGEKIVEVDSREISNELLSLRSDLMNAVATILPEYKVEEDEAYEKWFNYFNNLDINKEIAELPEIVDAQEKIKVSSRNIFTKYFAVKNKEIKLAKYTIEAPFDGYIKSNGILENSFVSVGTTLFAFDDLNNLEIAVPLLVRDFNQVNFNKSPKVKIYSDFTNDVLVGRINRKDNILEKNSQSLNVYVTFTNSKLMSHFLPGNYVNVEIEGKVLENVSSIPRNLVDNDDYVYTKKDGKLNRTQVEIVTVENDQAIILAEFEKGSELVTTILQKPVVGMAIQTLEEKELNEKLEAEKRDSTNVETVAVNN